MAPKRNETIFGGGDTPVPIQSGRLLVRLAPENVAMFRFLLEAHDNLAFFTVLEKRTALLKIVFSPQSKQRVIETLEDISSSLPLGWEDWPFSHTGEK